MIRLPASVVRASFSDLINRVAYGGERVVVTRRERPIAALVPIADFETLEKVEARAPEVPAPPPKIDESSPSREPLPVSPEVLADLRREVYEQARREVYEQVRAEAQKRLEALIAGRREP